MLNFLVLCRAVDKNAVPVDLQVGQMRIRCVPEAVCRVRSAVMVRGPPAGNPMSSITRIHLPFGVERFHVGGNRLQPSLVHRHTCQSP